MKVFFIAGWYPSKKDPTSGTFVKEHAKAVSLYNDIVVISHEWMTHINRGIYKLVEEEDGLRTIRLKCRKSPIPWISYFIYLRGVFTTFKKLVSEGFEPDIIHANVYFSGVPAVILGKRYRIPVVITEHFTAFPRRTITGVYKLMVRFAMNRADLITTVSEDLSKHIRTYGIKNIFKVVPNVVDTQVFYPPTNREPRVTKRLLLVALLTPKKGVPYLLKSLAMLSKKRDDFVLDIIGNGPNQGEYKDLTIELGIEDKVNFHGWMSKEQVAKYMRKASFFVLPSEWENLPCVLIEAMASGLPVVTTKVGGIPEIINEQVGVLVPSGDVEALVEAIVYMLDHYQDYSLEKIVFYAHKRFSYKIIGKQFNDIYRRLTFNE